ncbi:MAG: hypothetical protein COT26_01790 [Candidatus Kerfeldbacteria bacterium CG08_land_8_20_14_0_20_43_14]|uniref:Uncharacterized protein n=1 Tax=Candidatus Kerfeldbacteria bacterium CG08_land_8_20_14_0_20_43_14 TaxID=2014246 RepID=A0A2H0YSK1_9BACT|nr:MAG: hypothetical protein COT26_01790 [Candidatus Kerfeldbacteria bacterium CG08_land_8_20_14_0_20_43_14]
MRLVTSVLSKVALQEIANERFGDMVKGVVDIEQSILALGGELHADIEAFLLDQGSEQANLWGINVYPGQDFPDMVEFDSMINIRPSQGNKSRGVENVDTRKRILEVVRKYITQ